MKARLSKTEPTSPPDVAGFGRLWPLWRDTSGRLYTNRRPVVQSSPGRRTAGSLPPGRPFMAGRPAPRSGSLWQVVAGLKRFARTPVRQPAPHDAIVHETTGTTLLTLAGFRSVRPRFWQRPAPPSRGGL